MWPWGSRMASLGLAFQAEEDTGVVVPKGLPVLPPFFGGNPKRVSTARGVGHPLPAAQVAHTSPAGSVVANTSG